MKPIFIMFAFFVSASFFTEINGKPERIFITRGSCSIVPSQYSCGDFHLKIDANSKKQLAKAIGASFNAKKAHWSFGSDASVKKIEIGEFEIGGYSPMPLWRENAIYISFALSLQVDIKVPFWGWIWVRPKEWGIVFVAVYTSVNNGEVQVDDVGCWTILRIDTPWYITHSQEWEISWKMAEKTCEKVKVEAKALVEGFLTKIKPDTVLLATKGEAGIGLSFSWAKLTLSFDHTDPWDFAFDATVLKSHKVGSNIEETGIPVGPWHSYRSVRSCETSCVTIGFDVFNAYLRAAQELGFFEESFNPPGLPDYIKITIQKGQSSNGMPPVEITAGACVQESFPQQYNLAYPNAFVVGAIVAANNEFIPVTIVAIPVIGLRDNQISFGVTNVTFHSNDTLVKAMAENYTTSITQELNKMFGKQKFKLPTPQGLKASDLKGYGVYGICLSWTDDDESSAHYYIFTGGIVVNMNLDFSIF